MMRWIAKIFTTYFLLWLIQVGGRDVKKVKENYLPNYHYYHNLLTTLHEVSNLAQRNPGVLKIIHTYKSREGRDIPVVVVKDFMGTPESDAKKMRVLLTYGAHPREFLPVESALFFLKNVTESFRIKPKTVHTPKRVFLDFMLQHFIIYMVPMLNPDGRAYVERTQNYCWRGTSVGVDLERNFNWEFGAGAKSGSSSVKSDEEYRGEVPMSEPESRLIRHVVDHSSPFDCFVSFHSGIRHIYVPFSDTTSKRTGRVPKNQAGMLYLAQTMAAATGGQFKAGSASQLNDYTADGTMFDFMAGVYEIPFSLTVELWGVGDSPDLTCFDLFNPPSGELITALRSTDAIYATLFRVLDQWQRNKGRLPAPLVMPLDEPVASRNEPTRQRRKERSASRIYVTPYAFVYLGIGVGILFLAVCKRRVLPHLKTLLVGRRIVNLRSFGTKFTSLSSLKAV